MQSGSLSLLEPSGPVQALPFSNGTADFLFSKMCKPFLGPIQPQIQWITGEPSLGVKWPGPGADQKNLKIVLRLRMQGIIIVLPPRHLSCMQRGNFTFIFTDAVLFKHKHCDVSIENCSPWQDVPCAYTIILVQDMTTKDSYMLQQCPIPDTVHLLQGSLHVSETFTV